MISFYPGPSKVYAQIPRYVKEAHDAGILSMNHRSDEFIMICERTVVLMKEKLEIPADYTVFFASSATECWEIIAQSFVSKRSYHIFNGAFGQKWHEYTHKLKGGARDYPFGREEKLHPPQYNFGSGDGVICITQNETSNGTQVSNELIRQVKEKNPSHVVAVDATSSMGGIKLDFTAADIWFASVQKCFGLPAGLAIMICSPQAINKAVEMGENDHYNSAVFMNEMMKKWQTTYTPNVMAIYLLMRTLERVKPIEEVERKIIKRYEQWRDFLKDQKRFHHLIRNEEVHSHTVIPVHDTPERITAVKIAAKEKGFLLGEGYGDLKKDTFRIANFPAHKKSEIQQLRKFLTKQD